MFGKVKNLGFGKADKTQRSIGKQRGKQRVLEERIKTRQRKLQNKRVKHQNRMESSNPLSRWNAQRAEISAKKHDVKIRKLESEAKVAELDPKLQAEKAQTENELKKERARAKSKTASSTALAAGMASLGRGLSDENNQDDKANRESQEKIIKTIFQPDDEAGPDTSGNTGLTQGVE